MKPRGPERKLGLCEASFSNVGVHVVSFLKCEGVNVKPLSQM